MKAWLGGHRDEVIVVMMNRCSGGACYGELERLLRHIVLDEGCVFCHCQTCSAAASELKLHKEINIQLRNLLVSNNYLIFKCCQDRQRKFITKIIKFPSLLKKPHNNGNNRTYF